MDRYDDANRNAFSFALVDQFYAELKKHKGDDSSGTYGEQKYKHESEVSLFSPSGRYGCCLAMIPGETMAYWNK